MLKWTKVNGHTWTAEGHCGRRYEIEKRTQFALLPTVDGMKMVKRNTLEEAQAIAWGYEVAFRQAERLAKAAR